jgi:mono/diheme cytochrome c family protein
MTATTRTLAAALLVLLPGLALAGKDWKAPAEARDIASPLKPTAATVAAGKKLYEARCVNCHGSSGKGDGRASAYMQVKPDNLTTEWVQAETDGELFWKITTGRRPMPDFAGKLKDDERWQVIAYLRELGMLHGESAPPAEGK